MSWVSIKMSSGERNHRTLTLVPKGSYNIRENFPYTFTYGVFSLFMRVRFLRPTSNRETVLVDVDGDIVGFHAEELKRGTLVTLR